MMLVAALIIALASGHAQQLVLPGDHPDPSVVRIGKTYWASATTSNWFPAFPLMKSKDLIHWRSEGYVFRKKPEWADYYFWAPEISFDKGKVYVYYAAHKRGGNLCVAVARADRPEGPYTDLGPLMCQEDGSIDAFPVREQNGKLYLIWKEDANSVNKPTPIWAMEMNESRTALLGTKKELFRNDAPWEGNLVEGVSILRHGGYFYAFYAASGCCGISCTYAVGVARSKSLLGPWEKYSQNPVMKNNDAWVCPGHGTPVEKGGRYYFLHHAYNKNSIPFTGRQGILSEFRFTPDGWIEFIHNDDPSPAVGPRALVDHFTGSRLSDAWQWSVFDNIAFTLHNGYLDLHALPQTGACLGQKVLTADYIAIARIDRLHSTAQPGTGLLGDDKNLVGAFVSGDTLTVAVFKNGKEMSASRRQVPASRELYLKTVVAHSKDITFFYSLDGKNFEQLNDTPVDASFIPPWDRAVRVGIISRGSPGQVARFLSFDLHFR